jgi:hypothetical protein
MEIKYKLMIVKVREILRELKIDLNSPATMRHITAAANNFPGIFQSCVQSTTPSQTTLQNTSLPRHPSHNPNLAGQQTSYSNMGKRKFGALEKLEADL